MGGKPITTLASERAAGLNIMEIDMTDSEKVKKALSLIFKWSGYDGDHHKKWLLNELVKVLSDDYEKWVSEWQDGECGPETYLWDIGIAP